MLVDVTVEHVASPTASYTLSGLLQVVPPPCGSASGAVGRHTRRSLRIGLGAADACEPVARGNTDTDTAATTTPALATLTNPEHMPEQTRNSRVDATTGYSQAREKHVLRPCLVATTRVHAHAPTPSCLFCPRPSPVRTTCAHCMRTANDERGQGVQF